MKKECPWKERKLLKEVTMPDGFKLTFWLYTWNDDVASKLNHRFCIRIRKFNPLGRHIMSEQIGIRLDTWDTFIETVNKLTGDIEQLKKLMQG